MKETINEQEYREFVNTNRVELEQLQLKKQNLLILIGLNDKSNEITMFQNDIAKFTKLQDLTADVLHRLVERIEVEDDGTVRINYRFHMSSELAEVIHQ